MRSVARLVVLSALVVNASGGASGTGNRPGLRGPETESGTPTAANQQDAIGPCTVGLALRPGGSCAVVAAAGSYRFQILSNGEWRLDCLSADCVGSYVTATGERSTGTLTWPQPEQTGQAVAGHGFAACRTSRTDWLIEALPTQSVRAGSCRGCFIMNAIGDVAVAGVTTHAGTCTVGLVLGPGGSCTVGSERIEWLASGSFRMPHLNSPGPPRRAATRDGIVVERICDLNRVRIQALP